MKKARAAIEAMKDPTVWQVRVGDVAGSDAATVYNSMLDAALEPQDLGK